MTFTEALPRLEDDVEPAVGGAADVGAAAEVDFNGGEDAGNPRVSLPVQPRLPRELVLRALI